MRSPELMTTMRRPGRLLEIREPTAHDNGIGLEHIPRNLTIANINTKFVVKVDDKTIQEWVAYVIVVNQILIMNRPVPTCRTTSDDCAS